MSNERGKQQKNTSDIKKTKPNCRLNSILLVIKLNVNWLSTPNGKQRSSEWEKDMIKPSAVYKRMKKICHINRNQKRAGEAILIPGKI